MIDKNYLVKIQRGFLKNDEWEPDNNGDIFRIGFNGEQSKYIPVQNYKEVYQALLDYSSNQDNDLNYDEICKICITYGYDYFANLIEDDRKKRLSYYEHDEDKDEMIPFVNNDCDNSLLFFKHLIIDNNHDDANKVLRKLDTAVRETVYFFMQEASEKHLKKNVENKNEIEKKLIEEISKECVVVKSLIVNEDYLLIDWAKYHSYFEDLGFAVMKLLKQYQIIDNQLNHLTTVNSLFLIKILNSIKSISETYEHNGFDDSYFGFDVYNIILK